MTHPPSSPLTHLRTRGWALAALSIGSLVVNLDIAMVSIALPAIMRDLHFPEGSLAWVINAYMFALGGLLLLAGRLGDCFGRRKLFLIGIVVFTLASLCSGLSTSRGLLIGARAAQGIGSALISAVALSLVMTTFARGGDRERALGLYGFVRLVGGSIGLILGSVLLSTLNWRWIFFISSLMSLSVLALGLAALPRDFTSSRFRSLDIAGGITVTASMMLAVCAVVNGPANTGMPHQRLVLFMAAGALFIAFVRIEMRAPTPLIRPELFRSRNITVGNILALFWAAAAYSWFFISALYLSTTLHYAPSHVGLVLVPANLILSLFSLWPSPKLVSRFGVKWPIAIGLIVAAAGLALFAQAPVGGNLLRDVLPGTALFGVGLGMAFHPIMVAATQGTQAHDAGLASGVLNTSFIIGGPLGTALAAHASNDRTAHLMVLGMDVSSATDAGYRFGFLVPVAASIGASVLAATLLHDNRRASNTEPCQPR
jgi:EmrB/QacA subfamily drug resistance transporter